MRGFLFFLIPFGGIIWFISAKKLLKYSRLKGIARYIYAITAFPFLAFLSIITMLLWVNFSPDFLSALDMIMSDEISKAMKVIIIAPVFSIIPLSGFYAWWNIIKLIDKGF